MIRSALIVLAAACSLAAFGDSAESRYASGYDDGYAVGYNTTCKIRSDIIAGAWDDERYVEGYNDGYDKGSNDCLSDQSLGEGRWLSVSDM